MFTQDVRCYEEYGARLGSSPLAIGRMRFNIGGRFVVSGNEPDMPSMSPTISPGRFATPPVRSVSKVYSTYKTHSKYSLASSARAMQLNPGFVIDDRIQGELQVVSRRGVLVTHSMKPRHGVELASWQAGS